MKKIRNNPIILKMASLKIAVACLSLLFILTALGTYYQVDYGLYAAQARYFTSYLVLLGGWFPFPGAALVLWVFFFNLLAASFRYPFIPAKIGILFIHYGVLFLLISSFIIHYFARESVIALEEGELTNVSRDYFHSELALIDFISGDTTKGDFVKKVEAVDSEVFEDGAVVIFKNGLKVKPVYYYENSFPNSFEDKSVENASGFTTLSFQPPPPEREAIAPGGLFEVSHPSWERARRILLWEGEGLSFPITVEDKELYLKLQRKAYSLPFKIKLTKFTREEHFGTAIPKSFASDVVIYTTNGSEVVDRKTKIYMNNPFRDSGYTLFQASFSQDQVGNQKSVFATVENKTYYVPYIASGLIGFGLIFHFIYLFFKRGLRRKD